MKIKLMLLSQSTYGSVMSQSRVWPNVKVADNMCYTYIYIYVLYGYKCFMFKRSWMLCMFFKNVYVTAYIYIYIRLS